MTSPVLPTFAVSDSMPVTTGGPFNVATVPSVDEGGSESELGGTQSV